MTNPRRWLGGWKPFWQPDTAWHVKIAGFKPARTSSSVRAEVSKPCAGLRYLSPNGSLSPPAHHLNGTLIMDVEHINAIGNSLADLTKRTVDLRGYL
jgi:hypothetical protein